MADARETKMTTDDVKRRRKEIMESDPYWQEPLWFRIYQRVIYAGMGGLCTAFLFDFLGAPMWLQIAMMAAVAIGVLFFRMAYPGGLGGFYNGFMGDVLAEAERQQEAQKKTSAKK